MGYKNIDIDQYQTLSYGEIIRLKIMIYILGVVWVKRLLRKHAQITTTEVVAFGLGNPPISVPRSEEQTRPSSLAQVIHD